MSEKNHRSSEVSRRENDWGALLGTMEDPDIFWGLAAEIEDWAGNLNWLYSHRENLDNNIIMEVVGLSEAAFDNFCTLIGEYSKTFQVDELIQYFIEYRKNLKDVKERNDENESAKKLVDEYVITDSFKASEDDIGAFYGRIVICIASYLTFEDLRELAGVSEKFKAFVRSVPIPSNPIIDIPFGDLFDKVEGFVLKGLHGASNYDAPGLYDEVVFKETENNYKGRSQLGPGFYLTDGVDEIARKSADFFAGKRVSNIMGNPSITDAVRQVFQVFIKNFDKLSCEEVEKRDWWKARDDKKDISTARIDMDGREEGKQIKISVRALKEKIEGFDIRVLPEFENGVISDLLYLSHIIKNKRDKGDFKTSKEAVAETINGFVKTNPAMLNNLNLVENICSFFGSGHKASQPRRKENGKDEDIIKIKDEDEACVGTVKTTKG